MSDEEIRKAAGNMVALREKAGSEAEAGHWTEILRRARELHKQAAQARLPDSLVAALLIADAIEGLGGEIKKAAKR
jgi:hypothetical protein